MKTLIANCGEIAHLSSGVKDQALSGYEMNNRKELVYSKGLGILIEGNIIKKIDDSETLLEEYGDRNISDNSTGEVNVIDACGKAIVPGFVDSHNHLIWSGDRTNELAMRQNGFSYREISESGGGIRKTVDSTRKTNINKLVESGLDRVNNALINGTTSMEVKSGYGLDIENEIKILQTIDKIKKQQIVNIHPTWLGAHDFPNDKNRKEYIDELVSEQLPLISEKGLAKWVDVFCEPGWYTIEETEYIVNESKQFGLDSRLHVDEFVDSGGLELATELESVSGDHVGYSSDNARSAASEAGTMQTFLIGTPYVLNKNLNLPIRKCIDEGWKFSVATDFNPNCPIISLPLIGSILTHRMSLDPLESLIAVKRNPASTIYSGKKMRGIISEDYIADLNILWSEKVDGWCQTPGTTPVSLTMINGNIVNRNKVY